ncbi:unnamed protein product [Vitrella brassicaformis CCMP3155]|uniref:DUF5110 domain-containing protein n=1 Tax=Vitrella brassicaformis (strain CCMP3155) TaxID=1169540 RepID=A0A0G4GLT1_VITBC|nr:unnamed protein product [Vitrella brassicaformis CCMP3155]|eukprot:CEM31077.1 unnamed protein product [Vitrella brassicaformis CCMP3155]
MTWSCGADVPKRLRESFETPPLPELKARFLDTLGDGRFLDTVGDGEPHISTTENEKAGLTSNTLQIELLTVEQPSIAALHGSCRVKFLFKVQEVQGYALVSILDTNATHIEFGKGTGPSADVAIKSSHMVFDNNPTSLVDDCSVSTEEHSIQGRGIAVVHEKGGCLDVYHNGKALTRFCVDGWTEDGGLKILSVQSQSFSHAFGVGQQFQLAGEVNGDWLTFGRFGSGSSFGNEFRHNPDTEGQTTKETTGKGGVLQFPFMLALPKEGRQTSMGLLFDNTYKQSWDFSSSEWWTIATPNTPADVPHRLFVIMGEDPLTVRSRYMQLVGTPPVPPRKAFGLWLSEYGFESWDETDSAVKSVRDAKIPIDGIVLDLYWFGGIRPSIKSSMGTLDWDTRHFPDPQRHIAAYHSDHLALMAIEESYMASETLTYHEMKGKGYLATECGNPRAPIALHDWWGEGSMVDWTHAEGAAWVHDHRRYPNIISNGIAAHWTDLGEPSRYDEDACYNGAGLSGKRHADVHNLYNFLWLRSIYDGYVRNHRANQTAQRPFMLSRAGTLGIQRFGASVWSGDIASRLDALAMHQQSQMNMVTVGIDYYENLKMNKCPPGSEDKHCVYRISPAEIGWLNSNRFNVRQRYELIPYYYALAYRAFQYGLPVIAPLWYYFPSDATVRTMGSQKMLGDQIMVAFAAQHGQTHTDVYLPEGDWHSYHHPYAHFAGGQWLRNVSLFRHSEGVYTLPAYAKSGAIIPFMPVTDGTKDADGRLLHGEVEASLSVRVFASLNTGSSFEVIDDDGATVDHYDLQNRPVYRLRRTEVSSDFSGLTDGGFGQIKIGPEIDALTNGNVSTSAHKDTTQTIHIEVILHRTVRVSGADLLLQSDGDSTHHALDWRPAKSNDDSSSFGSWKWNNTSGILSIDIRPVSKSVRKVLRVFEDHSK